MNRNQIWAAAGRTLGVVTVTLIVMLTLAPGAWATKYKVLHRFSGSDGQQPRAGVVFDAAGNLYSTTGVGGIGDCGMFGGGGCGTVIKMTHNPDGTWTESVLYAFTGGEDGANPWATPVLDTAGNLYAATMWGGTYGAGVVFKLTPNPDGSWTESVLYSFTGGADGSMPYTMIFDGAGNLYGETVYGGAYGYGNVYKLTSNPDGSWTQTVIHDFTGGKDGANGFNSSLNGGLVFDSSGNLYGTTWLGGAYGHGVAFELMPRPDGSWKEKILHAFRAQPADGPTSRLVLDNEGSLYGGTYSDSKYGAGTVFKLTPGTAGKWTYTILYKFKGGNDGSDPALGVVLDAAGNAYGTTYGGGPSNWGTVFKLTPRTGTGWKKTILHTFTGGSDGAAPEQFAFDAAGNFYGVTAYGGSGGGYGGAGVIFEITP